MAEPTSVLSMVESYLELYKYDGLFNSDAGCACAIDDLEPCGCMSSGCCAGYKMPCTCEEGCNFDIGIEVILEPT